VIYTDEGHVEQVSESDRSYNSIIFYNTNSDIILGLSSGDESTTIYDNERIFSIEGSEIVLDDKGTAVSIDELKDTTEDIELSGRYDDFKITTEGKNKKLYINNELAFQFEIDDNDHIINIKDADGQLYNLDFDFDIEVSIPSLTSLKKTPTAPVKKLKRIYTVEEATRLSKPTGNTVKLRYK